MDFFIDLALFALVLVGMTAFLGVISAGLVKPFGGGKKRNSYERTMHTKQGWKRVQRKHT